MGDTEFVAAFYHFVIPIAKQFDPDMVVWKKKYFRSIIR
jgi:acetoin utilization deacetylase AcuC-like enzyme